MRIHYLEPSAVVEINKDICHGTASKHVLYDIGKIESALHSAYYPGSYPFQHGGIARVAGALAFYILKAHAFFDGNKRTALLASTIFMDLNGWNLRYPMPEGEWSELAQVLDRTAANQMDMEELKTWYDNHKIPLNA